MAARKSAAPAPQPANLTAEQMRSAIPKLERRIKDLEDFDPRSLKQRSDPRIEAIETKLADTISEVFGHGTIECHRFASSSLDRAGYNMMYATPLSDVIESVAESKQRELSNLRTIIELFQEKLADGGETPATRAKRAFEDLNLHPELARACTKLFQNGHYAEAVEAGCKVLDMLVKMRSMRQDLSGTELMQLVFSPKAPILKYNDQTNDSEKSEQQGMMFLFAGAMLALRNPRAHGLVEDHPQNAVEYLSFLSMLANSLDRTNA
ncbi:TIGR02391 family protein [Frateuria edaphi]|uniref:TIGR02391 family protein n=1 Tax=Frateuria edaphi TaxID=2898793 RepID=UPI001E582DA2|nr:TIGR02391 family protein [Frateuria edaphi]UGB45136.1 TIGR02391 family protein [Frateuria edaphi]